jgi:hypothetical protein
LPAPTHRFPKFGEHMRSERVDVCHIIQVSALPKNPGSRLPPASREKQRIHVGSYECRTKFVVHIARLLFLFLL